MKLYLVGPNKWSALENPFFESEGALAFAKYKGWNLYAVTVTIPMDEIVLFATGDTMKELQ